MVGSSGRGLKPCTIRASTSLSPTNRQVHVARDHQGRKLAVKVQHRSLREISRGDVAAVCFMVKLVAAVFPEFSYRWVSDSSSQQSAVAGLGGVMHRWAAVFFKKRARKIMPYTHTCPYVHRLRRKSRRNCPRSWTSSTRPTTPSAPPPSSSTARTWWYVRQYVSGGARRHSMDFWCRGMPLLLTNQPSPIASTHQYPKPQTRSPPLCGPRRGRAC